MECPQCKAPMVKRIYPMLDSEYRCMVCPDIDDDEHPFRNGDNVGSS